MGFGNLATLAINGKDASYLQSFIKQLSVLWETSIFSLLLAEPFDTILHLLIINKNILLGSCK
jgi:uncharacterized PurR-regulated membrane protein YhhQ (DUF165 family)